MVRQSLLQSIAALASPLRWGDALLKQLLFLAQCTRDVGYELRFPSLSAMYSLLGIKMPEFLSDPMFVATCVEKLEALMAPIHSEHQRDQHCQSLSCSIVRELEKLPKRAIDASSGTSSTVTSRREVVLTACLKALTLVSESVVGPELIELRGHDLRLICELDNVVLLPESSSS